MIGTNRERVREIRASSTTWSWLSLTFYLVSNTIYLVSNCPVGGYCRIHRLHLSRGVRPHSSKCPWHDNKQSHGEIPVMLELWGIRSTPSLLSLPVPLCPGVVEPDRVLPMGQIELRCVLMLNGIVWNRTVLTIVCLC